MLLSLRKSFMASSILLVISFYFALSSSPALGVPLNDAVDVHLIEMSLDFGQGTISGKDTITFAGVTTGTIRLLVDREISNKRVELAGESTPLPFTIHMPHTKSAETTVKELIITAPAQMNSRPGNHIL